MADTKITALTAITTVDPAVDVLPIVDVSDTTMAASGTTKKITSNQILGAGGTATLASATITGDLTVDTNVLKVDSANNRVGINFTSPTVPLYVQGSNATATAIMQDETNGAKLRLLANSINFDLSNGGGGGDIAVSGANPLTFRINGSEQMRLNSTGLGVGVTPSAGRLHIKGGSSQSPLVLDTLGYNQIVLQLNGANRGQIYADATNCFALVDSTGSNLRLVVTDTGNVGVGGNASVTGIDTGVARLFVVAPNSNTGMAATFIADSVGRGLLVADQGKTNSFGVEVVAGLVKTGGFTSGTSVALFANAVERARVKSTGQVRFVPLAADPSGAEAGDVYYNSSSNKLKCYNGSTWNDLF